MAVTGELKWVLEGVDIVVIRVEQVLEGLHYYLMRGFVLQLDA